MIVASAVVAALALLTAVPVSGAPRQEVPAPDPGSLLKVANQAAAWINSVEVETAHGIAWPSSPELSDALSRSLYAGTPGVVLFFCELARATRSQEALESASAGADDLLFQLEDLAARDGVGLYTGVAGAGFALHEAWRTTRLGRHLDGAKRTVAIIGRTWNDRVDSPPADEITDIIAGLAGTGLYLLHAHHEWNDERALMLATEMGDRLIALAREKRGGLMWAIGGDVPNTYPNFSHGTAGVCYFLASLHDATGEARYLDAARAGARYLLAIADTGDPEGEGARTCLIPRFDPDEYKEGEALLYYLGWCHGPAGTARFFHRMYEVTAEEEWKTWRDRCARTLLESGIPGERPPGFWNNVGPCCGNAGVAAFALDMHRLTNDKAYLDFARELTRDILARAAVDESGRTAKWVHAEHRVRPDFVAAQTGYMQGAAGIGLWLLRLHAFETKSAFTLRLPDDPF